LNGAMGYDIFTSAWGFGVARFDKSGNAKAFTQWNERQNWLHVSFVRMLTLKLQQLSLGATTDI